MNMDMKAQDTISKSYFSYRQVHLVRHEEEIRNSVVRASDFQIVSEYRL